MTPEETGALSLKVRLVAELGRDKKKSAILGALLVVAMVLVARMAVGQFVPSSAKGASRRSIALAGVADASGGSAAAENPAKGQQAGKGPKGKVTRDIFALDLNAFPRPGAADMVKVVRGANEGRLSAEQVRVLQEAQTLVLQSTIVGRRPAAMINGCVVGLGGTVARFHVVEVDADWCVVEKDGVRVTLRMQGVQTFPSNENNGDADKNGGERSEIGKQ
jgi:hypothetical protein